MINLGYTDGIVPGSDEGINFDLLMVKCLELYLEIEGVDGKLENFLNGYLLGYNDNILLLSDEGIKLRLSNGKVLGTVLGNNDIITLGLDDGTDMGYLDK